MADISAADFKRMQQERDVAVKELAQLKAQHEAVLQVHAQERTTLKELMNKAGYKEKRTYVYADDECRPVGIGGVCDKCGWSFNTGLRKGREKEGRQPHAIS